jgi:hypothetical protein
MYTIFRPEFQPGMKSRRYRNALEDYAPLLNEHILAYYYPGSVPNETWACDFRFRLYVRSKKDNVNCSQQFWKDGNGLKIREMGNTIKNQTGQLGNHKEAKIVHPRRLPPIHVPIHNHISRNVSK